MKHKVSELEGDELDAAVLLAEGWEPKPGHRWVFQKPPVVHYGVSVPYECHAGGHFAESTGTPYGYQPSVEWRHGGPIIERERLHLAFTTPPGWASFPESEGINGVQYGPTALVAAMRAYVASKFGEEVNLP